MIRVAKRQVKRQKGIVMQKESPRRTKWTDDDDELFNSYYTVPQYMICSMARLKLHRKRFFKPLEPIPSELLEHLQEQWRKTDCICGIIVNSTLAISRTCNFIQVAIYERDEIDHFKFLHGVMDKWFIQWFIDQLSRWFVHPEIWLHPTSFPKVMPSILSAFQAFDHFREQLLLWL